MLQSHLHALQDLSCCRKDIVGVAARLQHMDGTPVLKQERLFLQRLHSRKLTRDESFKSASGDTMVNAKHMLVNFCLPPCECPTTAASCAQTLTGILDVDCSGAIRCCPVAAKALHLQALNGQSVWTKHASIFLRLKASS